MSLLVMARHGQALPASYVGHEHGGDAGLSALGRRQAAVLGRSLRARGIRPDLVVSGGLARQSETAQICLDAMAAGQPLQDAIEVDPRWQEYDVQPVLAAYPSGPAPEQPNENPRGFQQFLDQSLLRWIADTNPPEGLTPWAVFAAAAPAALRELAERAKRSGSGTTVLIFTSAGPIAAVAADLLGLTTTSLLAMHRIVVNGSITKVISGSRGCHLLTFNDHAHFEAHFETHHAPHPEGHHDVSAERLMTYR